MKILEICPFSAGICGVWARVKQESLEFKKLGNKVLVFSSNIEKGSENIASRKDNIEGIEIVRFFSKKSKLSKNVYSFDFKEELARYSPDLVITHLLHPHSFRALKLCKEKNIPCYLVTHAPFNIKRKFPLNLATYFYNFWVVKSQLNQFAKIIAITRWEVPHLLKLGVKKEKIVYIPNGIPNEFFIKKKIKPSEGVLFLGRIAPVKNLESLIEVAKTLRHINFSIIGSSEKEYKLKIKKLIDSSSLKNVKIYPPIYDLNKKIKIIDQHKIFVLPSLREAMPQVLLEALARGKIVIASKTDGAKEIISDKKTGLLFEIGDSEQLAELINKNINGNLKIQRNAEKEAEKYCWKVLIKLYPFVKQVK